MMEYEESFSVRSNPSSSAYKAWSEQMTIMFGSAKVDVPEGQSGIYRVERYTVPEEDASFERIRSLFSLQQQGTLGTGGHLHAAHARWNHRHERYTMQKAMSLSTGLVSG